MGSYAHKHTCQKFAQEESSRQSKSSTYRDQPGRFRYNETKHAASRRAKGKADAHLVRTLCHRVGEHAIDPNSGENDCEHREADIEQHDKSSLGHEIRNPLIHGFDIE